jgi:hypothetical protein
MVKLPSIQIGRPKISQRMPRITPRTPRLTSRPKLSKGELYVGRGMVSRHYFRGAKRRRIY